MDERARRWRLVLGSDVDDAGSEPLDASDAARDAALGAVYGTEDAAPETPAAVARWSRDLRDLFPATTVRLIQRDAVRRLGAAALHGTFDALEPDVGLASAILRVAGELPPAAREAARRYVKRVAEALGAELIGPVNREVRGALARRRRTTRPRPAEIDWAKTLRANLRSWDPSRARFAALRLVGARRTRRRTQEVVLLVDQSGSMGPSLVHAAVVAGALATIPALRVRLLVFDTRVVDLTPVAHDPVAALFGATLGGGTDLGAAVRVATRGVEHPDDTVVVLISDLRDQASPSTLGAAASELLATGARLVAVLAVTDEGIPDYDANQAEELARLGVPSLAAPPNRLAALLAAALDDRDLEAAARRRGVHVEVAGRP